MKALLGQAHLGRVWPFIRDPAGVDAGHENAIIEHLLGARTREHVQRCLGHIGVRVARPLVTATEHALHRRHIHNVGTTRSGCRERAPQTAHQQKWCGCVAQLNFEHLERIDVFDVGRPTVHVVQVGNEPAGVNGGAGGETLQRRRPGGESQPGEVIRCERAGTGRRREQRMPGDRRSQGERMRIIGVPERHDLGQGTVGQRSVLGLDQGGVRTAGASHGLRCIVDENVERSLGSDGISQGDHLGRVAQIDSDDAQAVQPVLGIGHGGEAANGVARKPGRDGGVGTVTQQAECDVHADLGTAAGE